VPRIIEITLPPDQTDALVERIQKVEGLLGLRVQHGLSLQPPGDVVTAVMSSHGFHDLLERLHEAGWNTQGGRASLTVSDPTGVVVQGTETLLTAEPGDASWEEMLRTIARESNMHANGLLLMGFAGFVAAIGVATGAFHFVLAGMLLAPGFEPISRVALSLLTGAEKLSLSLGTAVKGHVALFAGAFVGALFLLALDRLPPQEGSLLSPDVLLAFWGGFSPTSLAVSVVAATAGALVVAANRSVLTGGAMVGLSLVPAPALVALGLFMGDGGLAGRGLLRWVVDATLVFALSLAVFGWKRATMQKRRALR
jgi:hypothetical protein